MYLHLRQYGQQPTDLPFLEEKKKVVTSKNG